MPSPPPLRPRGPLPARVYWTRRLLLLVVALTLVAGLARVLGSASDGSDGSTNQATTAGATTSIAPTTTPTRDVAEPARKKRKKRRTPTEPPLAEPTGACESSDIVATPVVTDAQGGIDVPITINLRTLQTPACTWTASTDTLTVSITSGDDPIWSSRECPSSLPEQAVVVRQAVDTPVVVTWDARRSDEECSDSREWARLGYYHVKAAALGGEPTSLQFELVRPASAVITKTVTPRPEPTTGAGGGEQTETGDTAQNDTAQNDTAQGDTAQNDTAHVPGEQGGGNSEG